MVTVSPSIAFIAISLVYFLLRKLTKKTEIHPLPPGPARLPIVGNIYDLPPKGTVQFQHWAKHKDLYGTTLSDVLCPASKGPMSSLTILGRHIIIFNDYQCAVDILEKQSVKTSFRPDLNFAYEFAGFKDSLSLTRDKKLFRQYRKAMSNVLGSRNAVAKFHPMQEIESRRFLLRVLNDPNHFTRHLRKEAGAFILKVTYGYSIVPDAEDPLVTLSESALDWFDFSTAPGKWLVDSIPIVRHIPEWMPGGGFKKSGRMVKKHIQEITEKPLAFTMHQRAENQHTVSYASDLLDQNESHNSVAWTSMGMYIAGADTTATSLKAFLLAMILFPEVQRKGQEEIDRVIGRGRLPSLADRDQLPYLNAMEKEVMRWHTSGPTGIPHKADEDIVYKGFLIPKDATLMWNAWLFSNDSATYPEPGKFIPDRFLKSDGHEPERDPAEHIFGFGRRVCPGRLVADSAMFVTIAQTLAAYSMSKPIGRDGKEIEPKIQYSPGSVNSLGPFDVEFNLRDPAYEEMIRNVEREHPFQPGHAEILSKIDWEKYFSE